MIIFLQKKADTVFLAKKILTANTSIITLSGDTGSGKTFLCRKIIQLLCGKNTVVHSPTFNILKTYKSKNFIIYHFDLYRIKHVSEIQELELTEINNSNMYLIEWPEVIESILPKNAFQIKFKILEKNKRICTIKTNTKFQFEQNYLK